MTHKLGWCLWLRLTLAVMDWMNGRGCMRVRDRANTVCQFHCAIVSGNHKHASWVSHAACGDLPAHCCFESFEYGVIGEFVIVMKNDCELLFYSTRTTTDRHDWVAPKLSMHFKAYLLLMCLLLRWQLTIWLLLRIRRGWGVYMQRRDENTSYGTSGGKSGEAQMSLINENMFLLQPSQTTTNQWKC